MMSKLGADCRTVLPKLAVDKRGNLPASVRNLEFSSVVRDILVGYRDSSAHAIERRAPPPDGVHLPSEYSHERVRVPCQFADRIH